MKFNAQRFESAKMVPRTEAVRVDQLREFFDAPEDQESPRECLWVVRGLTGEELCRAWDAEKRHKDIGKVLEAVTTSKQLTTKLRDAIGLGDTTPPELAKRLEMLVAGSVEPRIELPIAVKLAESFPVEFMQITHVITELTGLGATLEKPEAVSQATAA